MYHEDYSFPSIEDISRLVYRLTFLKSVSLFLAATFVTIAINFVYPKAKCAEVTLGG